MFGGLALDRGNTSTVYEQQANVAGGRGTDSLERVFSLSLLPEAGVRKRLVELAALPANWDGEGAEPLSKRTLDNALHIALALSEKTRFPDVTPNAGDTVTFEWESDAGSALMEIGHATYSFWMQTGDGERATDTGKLASSAAEFAALGAKIERKLFGNLVA